MASQQIKFDMFLNNRSVTVIGEYVPKEPLSDSDFFIQQVIDKETNCSPAIQNLSLDSLRNIQWHADVFYWNNVDAETRLTRYKYFDADYDRASSEHNR